MSDVKKVVLWLEVVLRQVDFSVILHILEGGKHCYLCLLVGAALVRAHCVL